MDGCKKCCEINTASLTCGINSIPMKKGMTVSACLKETQYP